MKVVKSVSFDVKILGRIDDFMITNKITNFSKAIAILVQMGIAYDQIQIIKETRTSDTEIKKSI